MYCKKRELSSFRFLTSHNLQLECLWASGDFWNIYWSHTVTMF